MAEVQSASNSKPRFSRILLKLSGEALAPLQRSGLDLDALSEIALEIKEVAALGVQLALVIGGGNFIRGSDCEARGMDRSTADQMGMLATVINALALQNALEHAGVVTQCCPLSRCRRCASRTFAAAPYAISKRAAW